MIIRTGVLLLLFSTQAVASGNWGPVFEQGKRINPNETRLTSSNAKEKAAIIEAHSGTPGCYILCIGPPGGLYPLGGTNEFHGLIRINGAYRSNSPTNRRSERFCYPNDLKGQSSSFLLYQKLCNDNLSSCNNFCNGNGDTGGFFTNRPIR